MLSILPEITVVYCLFYTVLHSENILQMYLNYTSSLEEVLSGF